MKYHFDLTSERWYSFSIETQFANIGSEVALALKWRRLGNPIFAQNALYRSLDLFDLTLSDPKYTHQLKEIARTRELWLDFFIGDNLYQQTESMWDKFTYQYTFASAIQRHKN